MNKKSIFPLILDFIFTLLLIFFTYHLRFSFNIPTTHLLSLKILYSSALLFIIFNLILGVYNEEIINLDIMGYLFLSGIITYTIYFILFLVIKIYIKNLEFSTPILIIFAFLIPFISTLVHLLFKNIYNVQPSKKSLLIIGFSKQELEFIKKYQKELEKKFKIVGTYLTEKNDLYPTIDEKRDIFSILEQYNIQAILFGKNIKEHYIEQFIYSPSIFSLSFYFIPELYDKFIEWGKPIPLSDFPIFQLDNKPIKGLNLLLQRFFDILISIIVLILFFPFGVFIAILIAIDSEGPIFFRQIRLGKFGKPFKIIKFRTMVKNAEEIKGPQWTEENDPRITKIGKILRRFSLDEIPQLLNVLVGQMSLVGPRPERPYFVEKYPVLKGIRMLVKPGITGLAQVNGTYDLNPEEKLKYDIYMITHFNIFLYFFILIKTVIIIITGRGRR